MNDLKRTPEIDVNVVKEIKEKKMIRKKKNPISIKAPLRELAYWLQLSCEQCWLTECDVLFQ